MTFTTPKGDLWIADPEMVNEIYVQQNKYIDKYPKYQRVWQAFTGNSILFNSSNELWAAKRKHLSMAFYKDKLTPMLGMIIDNTMATINTLKKVQVATGKSFNMVDVIQELMMNSILMCVFGQAIEEVELLNFKTAATDEKIHPGFLLRKIFTGYINKVYTLPRLIFDSLDFAIFGQEEKLLDKNNTTLRDYIMRMIIKRREDFKKPGFVDKGDFLTNLLKDELFANQDVLIIDECITFLLAATQTSTTLIINCVYNLSRWTEARETLRKEMRRFIDPKITSL